jgi:hypothetical protein
MTMAIRNFYPIGFLIRFPASVLHRRTSGMISDMVMKTEDVIAESSRLVECLFVSNLWRLGARIPFSSLEREMYRKTGLDRDPV